MFSSATDFVINMLKMNNLIIDAEQMIKLFYKSY